MRGTWETMEACNERKAISGLLQKEPKVLGSSAQWQETSRDAVRCVLGQRSLLAGASWPASLPQGPRSRRGKHRPQIFLPSLGPAGMPYLERHQVLPWTTLDTALSLQQLWYCIAYPPGQVDALHRSKFGGPCSHLLKVTHHPLVNDLNITQLDLQGKQQHVSDKVFCSFCTGTPLTLRIPCSVSCEAQKSSVATKTSKRRPRIACDILGGICVAGM